jgi:hypothetical protein
MDHLLVLNVEKTLNTQPPKCILPKEQESLVDNPKMWPK